LIYGNCNIRYHRNYVCDARQVWRKSRERKAFNELSADEKEKVLIEQERKKQEADELISVILPTINND
jgi:flagellar biosynthesis chaperone FliJ